MIKFMMVFLLNSQISTYKVTYYGESHNGRLTASGEVFDKSKLTCAAGKRYKLGDRLKVTNYKNGKSVVVKVNDRGGFEKKGVHLDLSEAAFKRIGDLKKGVLKVGVEKL